QKRLWILDISHKPRYTLLVESKGADRPKSVGAFCFPPRSTHPRSERIEGSPSGACARHMGAGARVFSFFFFPFTRCTHAGQPPPIASGGGCSVSQKRHAPGGTHFCPHTRDRNSFPLVSPWGQN